jgi:hypothetical protein
MKIEDKFQEILKLDFFKRMVNSVTDILYHYLKTSINDIEYENLKYTVIRNLYQCYLNGIDFCRYDNLEKLERYLMKTLIHRTSETVIYEYCQIPINVQRDIRRKKKTEKIIPEEIIAQNKRKKVCEILKWDLSRINSIELYEKKIIHKQGFTPENMPGKKKFSSEVNNWEKLIYWKNY